VKLEKDGKFDEALPLALQSAKFAQASFGPSSTNLALAVSVTAKTIPM
jgi:hypothetical protein